MRTLAWFLLTGAFLALAGPPSLWARQSRSLVAQASQAPSSANPASQQPPPSTTAGQPPSSSTTPAGPAATIAPRIIGTMSELMVDVIYPTSDAILYIETRTPKNDVEWNELQAKALMLAEAGNLLMLPGRARDQDRWLEDAKLMRDAGAAAFRAAKNKDVAALAELNEQVYMSCTTCHQQYRTNYGRGRPTAPAR